VLRDNIFTIPFSISFSFSVEVFNNAPKDMGGNVTLVEPEPDADPELEAELYTLGLFAGFPSPNSSVDLEFDILSIVCRITAGLNSDVDEIDMKYSTDSNTGYLNNSAPSYGRRLYSG
jgi:hypothetical protein